ncbi:phage tail protein [Acinetobacter nosocomialis]|uniref:phage tail protein n=1 Tax=Acinetobacter nosocomialis TaxID=106654 RepID=UPI0002CE072F|nr:phage tail protein [Acinetobacter nosocomialis]ENU46269.1 hypothetical protein F984_02308 [Acinetobacter nosocomialis NIPH 2119]QXC11277.1 phage tail protein [Acinetobacter nosocomialis]
MSERLFTWAESLAENSGTQSFNTLSSKFGDGYEQNISVGINNRKGSWNFTRTDSESLITEIKKFLDDHKGADSFYWQSPKDGLIRVKAGDYQLVDRGSGTWKISTTFTQVFYP